MWSPLHGTSLQPGDLVQLHILPGIFRRYYIATMCGGITLLVFFTCVCYRTTRLTNPVTNQITPSITAAITTRQWWIFATLSLFFYILLLSRLLQYPVPADDAYENYRYVYNWVNGISFDYNPGERLLGFASTLNVAVLFVACLIFDHHNIAIISQMLCTLWQAAAYLLVFLFLRGALKSEGLALLGSILYATNGLVMIGGLTGKESSLVMMLIILSLYMLQKRSYCSFAWTSALLAIARPEGIIWFALAIAWLRSESPKTESTPRASSTVWVLPALMITFTYLLLFLNFRTVIPRGMLSRFVEPVTSLTSFSHTAPWIFAWLGEYTFQGVIRSTFSAYIGLYLAYLLQGLAVFCLLPYILNKNRWLQFYSLAVVWLLGTFSLVDPRCFSWYYAWFAFLPIFLVAVLIKHECALLQRTNSLIARTVVILVIVFQIYTCAILRTHQSAKATTALPVPIAVALFHGSQSYEPLYPRQALQLQWLTLRSTLFKWLPGDDRLLLYNRAVNSIRSINHKRNAVIATPEPGMAGFSAPEFRILDLSGVLSATTFKYYPVPVNGALFGARDRISPQEICELNPNYLITLDHFVRVGLLQNSYFLRHYRLMHFWPLRIWDGRGLYAFEMINQQSEQINP